MSANLRDLERTRPLSAREREQIRNRMRMNQSTLDGKIVVPTNKAIGREGMDPRRQGRYESFMRDDVKEDTGLLRAKINRDKRLLEMNDPKNIDRKQRAQIEQQVKRDTAWIRRQMCPGRLFNVPRNKPDGTKHPDFDRAVTACKREHTEQYKSVANRLKENLRRIDPDGESNLEKFRPKS